jgi:uncharacterized protein YnzC (UPF0291/DUF896 family)
MERKGRKDLLEFDKNWLCRSISPKYKFKQILKVLMEGRGPSRGWREETHSLWTVGGQYCKFISADHGHRHATHVFILATRLYYDIIKRCKIKDFLNSDEDKFYLIISIWLHDWGMRGPLWSKDKMHDVKILNNLMERYGGDKIDETNLRRDIDDFWVRNNHSILTYFHIVEHSEMIGLNLLKEFTGDPEILEKIGILCLHQKGIDQKKIRDKIGDRMGDLNALLRLLDACDERWYRLLGKENISSAEWELANKIDEAWEEFLSFMDEISRELKIAGIHTEELLDVCHKIDEERISELLRNSKFKELIEEKLKNYKHYKKQYEEQFKKHIKPKMLVKDVYFYKGEIVIVPYLKDFVNENDPDIQETIRKIKGELERSIATLQRLKLPFTADTIRLWREGDPQPEELEVPEFRESFFTYEVRDEREFAELEIKGDFLEGFMRGKFVDEPISWQDIEKKIIRESFECFEWKEAPPDISDASFRMFFIIGKYGVGKSTFMLHWLNKCLSSERSWIKSIVFLNSSEMGSEEGRKRILEDLDEYAPDNVILAVDALYREGDTPNKFIEKYNFLREIAKTFRLVVTLRDSDFELLKKFPIDLRDKIVPLMPTEKSTEIILMSWLNFYGVNYESESPEFKEAVHLLNKKRDGNLPYYIHHLVIMLYSRGQSFSKEIIEEIPEGMIELILYTIDRELLIFDEKSIPLILLTLSKQRKSLPLSLHFFKWIADAYSKSQNLEEVISKLKILTRVYLLPKPFKFENKEIIQRYQLDDIWKTAVDLAIKEPKNFSRFKSPPYLSEVCEVYDNFRRDLTVKLKEYLESALKRSIPYDEVPSLANLLVDLAKFDKTQLSTATNLFNRSKEKIHWSNSQLTYIRSELSLTWFISAIDLRDEGKPEAAEEHLEEAIKIKEDFKQALHLYVYLLQRRLHGVSQEEKEILINRIETLYLRLESFGPDPITWQTKALFYKEIGDYNRAEELFEKSIIFFPEHVPIIQAFAIFCEERANKLWRTNREESEKYIKKAYELYEKGRIESKRTGFSEKELLNAYANFLAQLASWKDVNYERIFGSRFSAYDKEKIQVELDKEVDDIFDEVTRKYPDHAESRNSYADFLMDIAGLWLKERYPNNLNIEKAEKLLKDFLEDNPLSQNIFARICQEKGQFDVSEYWFDRSISNPKISLLKNPQLHVAICRHNKGKLYMSWADKLEGEQRNRKLKLAENELHLARKLPENNFTYHHLSEVYESLAYFYAKYYKREISARRCARKSVEFAKKAEWININFIRRLIRDGEEIMQRDPRRALYFYEVIVELDENNFWAHFRKGQCHANIGDLETAIYEYCKSAELQNTLRGYYSSRKELEMIKEKLEIKNESLWERCLKSIKWCLEGILQLEGIFESKKWKNHIDYAKNLMEYGVFLSYTAPESAIECFEKALGNLEKVKNIFQDTRIIEEYNLLLNYENMCKKWIKKLEEKKDGQLLKIDEILILSQETYECFGDIRRACGFLEEYLELLLPFLDCKELSKIGKKFLEWKKYVFASKCLKEIIKLDPSLRNLRELVNVNIKLGRFEDGINNISNYKHLIRTKEEEKDISWLLRKCQSAINVKERISDGLMLLISIAKVAKKCSSLELARLFYETGRKLHLLKYKIDLRPLIYSLADRRISDEELNFIRRTIIPQHIIKSCLWKAKELDPSFSREIEQVLHGFKKQTIESYFYSAEQLRKVAEEAEDIVEIVKYMTAAFYYSYFLAIKMQEIKEDNEKLSELWGKTGGSLVKICNSSPLKISHNVLIECFRESINYNNENRESWGQLGRQLFCMKDLDKAKIALEKSGNRYSLTTLGKIAELEGNKALARDYYVKASELIGQSEETKVEEKAEEYESVAEKLVDLGFMDEALRIYETEKELPGGRKRTLIEAKIQLLKNKNRGKEGKPDGLSAF